MGIVARIAPPLRKAAKTAADALKFTTGHNL
jgi:hypothetical protein